jgi:hypothetical protein
MTDEYGLVLSLTADGMDGAARTRALRTFAYEFGWVPSDTLEEPALAEYTNGHLIVEHGLETSAVISFLRSPFRFSDLGTAERKRLFSLSYNNLVDWHIQVEPDTVTFVYNRTEQPTIIDTHRLSRERYEHLRSTAFEKITERRPTSNLPALDDALIKTISIWKRVLSAELGYAVSNETLSALFNAIIFARAAEDHARFRGRVDGLGPAGSQALLSHWFRGIVANVGELLVNVLTQFVHGEIPSTLLNRDRLREFDGLDRLTVASLLTDFYRNKYASYYDYDFSIISKHALSRIYESYVSILRLEDSPQASLFPELPVEERDRAFGSVYTPQYVARFFGRYLRERTPPAQFRTLKSCDPACGSGIFLRTMLEMQSEPVGGAFDPGLITRAFSGVLGVDVDENAAYATRLSLALLHLVLTDRLPEEIDITSEEAIQYFTAHPEFESCYDAVFANPPFVAVEGQTPEMRQLIANFLGEYGRGRIDMSVPFLMIALRLLKPGGFGCFVLPHSFLLSHNAAPIRALLAESAIIHCVADLSAVRVFGDVGSYVVLLVFQKHGGMNVGLPPATVVKCQEFPGQALQDAVEDRLVENQFYSVYKVEQDAFKAGEWVLLPPHEAQLRRKFRSLRKLSDFLVLRQGVITGADDVFLRDSVAIPAEERSIYLPLLRDREMIPYVVPPSSGMVVFYPFVDGGKITPDQLRGDFPETWKYLEGHQDRLKSRGSLVRYGKQWWEPMWPRSPHELLRSKLVSPHLILVPRFSWDVEGRYAVTRSPFLYPKTSGADRDMLRYFLAILNSSPAFWHLTSHSHVYRGGYLMLESKTLAALPVPDPATVEVAALRDLLGLVDARMAQGSDAFLIEREIDNIVASFFDLTTDDRKKLGF